MTSFHILAKVFSYTRSNSGWRTSVAVGNVLEAQIVLLFMGILTAWYRIFEKLIVTQLVKK
jgi:hypothetical protein